MKISKGTRYDFARFQIVEFYESEKRPEGQNIATKANDKHIVLSSHKFYPICFIHIMFFFCFLETSVERYVYVHCYRVERSLLTVHPHYKRSRKFCLNIYINLLPYIKYNYFHITFRYQETEIKYLPWVPEFLKILKIVGMK